VKQNKIIPDRQDLTRLVLALGLANLLTFGCGGSRSTEGTPGSGGGGTGGSGVVLSGDGGTGGASSPGGAAGQGSLAGASGDGGMTSGEGGSGASAGGTGSGGIGAAGGSGGAGAASMGGSGGGPGALVQGPCDIYASGNTPCVAAHSTVRALYKAYSGSLYQLMRASDSTTKDVPVLTPGGFVNTSVQDAFCTGTTCTITIIYDQSPQKNDLPIAGKSGFMAHGLGANAADGKVMIGGHTAHGIYVTGDPHFISNKQPAVAYRNVKTKGVATGDQPESMYMVLDGTRWSAPCCFDYGNAETTGTDQGNGTMEAIYWGSDTGWSKGVGNGPWVCGDLENGMYKGNVETGQGPPPPSNTSITGMAFVTTMLKGFSGNHFGLKAGNAQSGSLEVKWDGTRPPPTSGPAYSPKRLKGAIILGTGGDGSYGGTGTFFEGAMTSGVSSDAIDDAIQANIVAAGYGK
jgi:non-reducing end alpha-L-arabinofuranosidase